MRSAALSSFSDENSHVGVADPLQPAARTPRNPQWYTVPLFDLVARRHYELVRLMKGFQHALASNILLDEMTYTNF